MSKYQKNTVMNMDLHSSSARSNQEVCGVGGTATPRCVGIARCLPSGVGIPRCLPFKCWNPTLLYISMFSKGVLIFIELPVSLHWMDDKSEIGQALRFASVLLLRW